MTNSRMHASAEYLRLALPLMSRYEIPVTPENYAVWYAYVAGTSTELSTIIDQLVANDEAIDEATTQRLYRDILRDDDVEKMTHVQQSLRQIATHMSSSLEDANSEVTRYEQSLTECSSRISASTDQNELPVLVSELLDNTSVVQQSSRALRELLDNSKKETERLRLELEKAKEEAKKDALTGLANRRAFQEILGQLVQQDPADSPGHCIIIADLDHFKKVNDRYGHLLGDKVLKITAEAIKNVIKGQDTGVRWGGEEFAIILPHTSLQGARAAAENIRSALARARIVKPNTGEAVQQVTLSLGITQLVAGESMQQAIERADAALYRAKQNGRDRIELNPPPTSSPAQLNGERPTQAVS